MKSKQHFSTAISNEEHLDRVKTVYDTEILPTLEESQKAYAKYVKDKEMLSLTPA